MTKRATFENTNVRKLEVLDFSVYDSIVNQFDTSITLKDSFFFKKEKKNTLTWSSDLATGKTTSSRVNFSF